MNRCLKKVLFVILFLMLSVPFAGAEPVQLFLESDVVPQVNKPIPVKVMVLDEEGTLVKDYSGPRVINLDLPDYPKGTEPLFKILDNPVSFNEGQGTMRVLGKSPGQIDMKITIDDVRLSGYFPINFIDAGPISAVSNEIKEDETSPQVKDIEVEADNRIRLFFSEELEDLSATQNMNYLAITNKKEIHPATIEYRGDEIVLIFDQDFYEDEEGYVEINDVKDLSGNMIESDTRSPDFQGSGCPDACPHS